MTSPETHNGAYHGGKSPGSPSGSPGGEPHAPYAAKTRGYMQVLSLTSVGIEMAVSVVIGLFVGQWLDRKAGTEPLFLFVFLLIGCAAAGKAVWRAVKKADRMVDDPTPPQSGGGSAGGAS
jgi:ATP synthase protein I